MEKPFISVIIPVHNRRKTIQRALDSVLEQTYRTIEVIVVDDGSTDDTDSFLHQQYGSQIKLIKQTNQGVSSARNQGIKTATGNYIALLDSDDTWHPQKIEKQVAFHRTNPTLRISQTQEIWIRNGKRVNACKKHRKPQGDIFTDSLELCTISPSSVFMEKTLFAEMGEFDEQLPACEDFELWLRISSQEPVGLLDEALLTKYGGHSDQLSRRFPAMDRYRIYSLLKIWLSGLLTDEQQQQVAQVARQKMKILSLGAAKRGNDLSPLEEVLCNVLNQKITIRDFPRYAEKTFLNEALFS